MYINKLKLYYAALETKRRCNFRCAHCMRDESQNINVAKEMIDDFLILKY